MSVKTETIQRLRKKTGVGIMDCKQALSESSGDFEKALEYLRVKGLAKVVKKSDRAAHEGAVFVAINTACTQGCLVEVNCETDFVSKNESFQSFGQSVADEALKQQTDDPHALTINNTPLDNVIADVVLKTGELVCIKQIKLIETHTVHAYIHLNGRIGVLVGFDNTIDSSIANDIAMQVAACNPSYLTENDVPDDILNTERDVMSKKATEAGKPSPIIEKMVTGHLERYFNENCLVRQDFIKDPEKKVSDILPSGTRVSNMIRFALA